MQRFDELDWSVRAAARSAFSVACLALDVVRDARFPEMRKRYEEAIAEAIARAAAAGTSDPETLKAVAIREIIKGHGSFEI